LPEKLAALVLERPAGTFSIATTVALEQLRTGAVRIPFGKLRQDTPPGTFANDGSHDATLIDLPLSLILAAIGPAGLAKRAGQKRTDVPDEVVGVFGSKERGAAVTITAPPARTAAPAPTAAKPAAPPPAAAPPSSPKPIAPAAAPLPPQVSKPVTPVASPPAAPKQTTYISQSPTAPKAPASAPLPFSAPKPAAPLPFATVRPSPPPSAAPTTSGERVVVKIEAVSGSWPDAVRQEIEQFKLERASISIPASRLEPGLKTGRIVFTWAELCAWLDDPLPASANGQSEVELPLHVIAPLFMVNRRAGTPRKIVTGGEEMPDVFGGAARPGAPAAAAPSTPAPTPAIVPAATAVPAQATAPPAPADGAPIPKEIVNVQAEADLSPEEVVEWMMTLPGVAGAVLASNDGLLVAGQLPAPLEAETMAAFLPQLLMRINVCTEEIRLGTMRSVTILVGQTPCAMFKAGALCLAVLGHPGKGLPEAALERMAGELARKTQ
jgi:predicted regulator of Ras-like GTPase activity (Roadblock/LC7/MglB family)